MARGSTCPTCNNLTFHDHGSMNMCSVCGTVGWSWNKSIKYVGKGKGYRCPNCAKHTLHQIGELKSGDIIMRCGTCDYSLIESVAVECAKNTD